MELEQPVREVRSRQQKALKPYVCCECGQEIPKGTVYLRVDVVCEGGITQDIKHVECGK